jgi:formamidopyrimidine-DNA glycosylase
MPELPEAERARELIERRALNRTIAVVDDTDSYVCRPHAPGEIAAALAGHQLPSAHRRGKTLWVESGGPVLGLHLGMAGRFVVDQDPAPRGWDRFSLEFEGGGRLALRDKRRLSRAVLDPDLSRLGPDAAEATRAQFRERVGRGTTPVKARLLDQSAIAGVGNLLADETLWRAGIDPRRSVGELEVDELDALRRSLATPSARAACTRAISSASAVAAGIAPAAAWSSSGPPSGDGPPSGVRAIRRSEPFQAPVGSAQRERSRARWRSTTLPTRRMIERSPEARTWPCS